MIERVEDQDNVITNEALDQQFGPLGAEPVDDESDKVHVALLALTGSESFAMVLGAAPSGSGGAETFDPSLGSTEWRKAQSSSATNFGYRSVQPTKSSRKTSEVVGTGSRRYERSKSNGTTIAVVDVDIKSAALEDLVPCESEEHLAMNRTRLITYEQVRSEIHACAEARRQRAPQIRWRWTALANEARTATKVKIRTRIRVQARTLLVGNAEARPLEHGVLVESKESIWLWWNPKP